MFSTSYLLLSLTPTAVRVAYHATGMNDYNKALRHFSKFKFTDGVTSTLIGVTKLIYSSVAAYLILKPFLNYYYGPNVKPSNIDEFKRNFHVDYVTRVIHHASYESGSAAYHVSEFCKKYFEDYPLTDYDLANSCVKPIASRKKDSLKKFILSDGFGAAFRLSKTADKVDFEISKGITIEHLSDCTDQNKRYRIKLNPPNTEFYRPSFKGPCVIKRIAYLSSILNRTDANESLNALKKGCIDAWTGIDQCAKDLQKEPFMSPASGS